MAATTFHSTLPSRAAIDKRYYEEGMPKWKKRTTFPVIKRKKAEGTRAPAGPGTLTERPRMPREPAPALAGNPNPPKGLPPRVAHAAVGAAPVTQNLAIESRRVFTPAAPPHRGMLGAQFPAWQAKAGPQRLAITAGPVRYAGIRHKANPAPTPDVQHDANGGVTLDAHATKASVDRENRTTKGKAAASLATYPVRESNEQHQGQVVPVEPLSVTDEPVGPHARTRQGRKNVVSNSMNAWAGIPDKYAKLQAEADRLKALRDQIQDDLP